MDVPAARTSFEAFVRARTPALTRLAFLLTGNHHDAEDLVQNALARSAVRWHRLDDPEAYLRRVLYTQAVSRWRRLRARPAEALTGTPHDRPVETDLDTGLALAAALRRLTPKQRAVLVLRFYQDHTEVETALILGVSPGTVKSQTRYALRRLRELAPDIVLLLEVGA